MSTNRNQQYYDLEERCLNFAKRVNEYVRKLPKDIPNIEMDVSLLDQLAQWGQII